MKQSKKKCILAKYCKHFHFNALERKKQQQQNFLNLWCSKTKRHLDSMCLRVFAASLRCTRLICSLCCYCCCSFLLSRILYVSIYLLYVCVWDCLCFFLFIFFFECGSNSLLSTKRPTHSFMDETVFSCCVYYFSFGLKSSFFFLPHLSSR